MKMEVDAKNDEVRTGINDNPKSAIVADTETVSPKMMGT